MSPFRVAAVLTAALLVCLSGPVAGQSRCDSRERLIAQLAERYSEVPIALGVTSGGGLVEILAAADGSTWTIVVTTPRGRSCMVAAGEGWRGVARTPATPET